MVSNEQFLSQSRKVDGVVRKYRNSNSGETRTEFTPAADTAAALMARKTRNAERWNIAEFGGPIVSFLSLQAILPTMFGSVMGFLTNNQQIGQVGLGLSGAETCLVGVGLVTGAVGL